MNRFLIRSITIVVLLLSFSWPLEINNSALATNGQQGVNSDQKSLISVNGNSNKIVWSSVRDGNNEIYVMNSDGSGQTRLTYTSSHDLSPDWSPDGNQIVYDVWNRQNNDNAIYKMNADGSSQTRLSSSPPTKDSAANWSPDGTKIVFQSDRDGNFEIYTMNSDGSGVTRLTYNSALDSFPDWSPDSSRIVFSSNRDGNDEIYIMNSNGTGQSR
jgi:Tol biopolymer transport system component